MRNNHCQGFTLIELIIVISISSILLAIAAPSLGDFLKNTKLNGATQDLYSILQQARSEAIKRNAILNVYNTNDDTNWSGVVFLCQGTDGTTTCAVGDANFVRQFDANQQDLNIIGNASTNAIVSFTASGRLNEGGNTANITFCDSRTTGNRQFKRLSTSVTGRTSLTTFDDETQCNAAGT